MRSVERGTRGPSIGAGLISLALPVLPVLAAEPVYLLVDGVIVGGVGERELAALGAGSLVLLVLGTQMNFLSYGTTARAARLHGADRTRDAVAEGVQASWLALAVGAAVVAVVLATSVPLTSALSADEQTAGYAREWLRVAIWGVPAILLTAAGNGWMRGVQRTRTPVLLVLTGVAVSVLGCLTLVPVLGLVGSAVANLAGQVVTAAGFLAALGSAHRGPLRPRWSVIRAQLRLGGDLVVRTASFQVTFAVATSTAAAAGVATLGAHHLAQQWWSLYTLLLDAVAVAAQALVGEALGAGLPARCRVITRSVVWWSLGTGVLLALATGAARRPLVGMLTSDPAVGERLGVAMLGIALVVVPAAVVFGLDGVLLGAGDAAYLRTTTVLAALLGFLPLLVASRTFGWGLAGIWAGMAAFVLLRLLAVSTRAAGDRWLAPGADIPSGRIVR